MSVYLMLPSCVPATNLETAGFELKALDLYPFLNGRWVLDLGEMMNYPGVINGDEEVLDKIKIAEGKKVNGHAPEISGKNLCAYIVPGIRSEHECTTLEEARERLRLGVRIMIREGTHAKNLEDLLPLVTSSNVSRFIFAADDCSPEDLMELGHMDHIMKKAVKLGLDPLLAIRMATINSAEHFGLVNLGAIAPGYNADLAVIDNLNDFNVTLVFKNGELVAQEGKALYVPPLPKQILLRSTMNAKPPSPEDFRIEAQPGFCRVIEIIPDQIITKETRVRMKATAGLIEADPESDILKLAVVERHDASGNIGLGLVKGFGLRKGAFASTVAHDSHNIIVVGTNDTDMLCAVLELIKMQGGLVVANGGKIIDFLSLPIAGLISDRSIEYVVEKRKNLKRILWELGCTVSDPFMALSFLALPVIPELKLTDKGLVDVREFKTVSLFV